MHNLVTLNFGIRLHLFLGSPLKAKRATIGQEALATRNGDVNSGPSSSDTWRYLKAGARVARDLEGIPLVVGALPELQAVILNHDRVMVKR